MNKPASGTAKKKNKQSSTQKQTKLFLDAVFSALFLLLITVLGIFFIFSPKKKESVSENRMLATMPVPTPKALWSGSFTSGFTDYVADHFVFRDKLIMLKSNTEDLYGVRVGGVRIYSDPNQSAVTSTENETEEETKQPDETSFFVIDGISPTSAAFSVSLPMPAIDLTDPYYLDSGNTFDIFDKQQIGSQFGEYAGISEEELTGEQRGPLFVIGDAALEIFYGSEKVSKDYAAAVNAYKKALGPTVNVYNMVIPNHFEFGLPQKYKSSIGKEEKPFIDLIHDTLDDDVIFVDIYDTLRRHYQIGEYLYFRSDHHWTGLGAYRAYEKFCECAGMTPVALNKYEKKTLEGFLGTLYNSSLDSKIKAHPDTVEYYVPFFDYHQTNLTESGTTYEGTLISKNGGYLTFMGGDIPLATITSDVQNGRKIIVFKESYGNAFCPFLVPNFETVYVADIRSFPYNAISFIKENGITDVLILNNIMSANTPARVANIVNLMTK